MTAALQQKRRVIIKAGHHAGLMEDDLTDRHAEAAVLMPVEAEQRGDTAPRAQAQQSGGRPFQRKAVDAVRDRYWSEPLAVDGEMKVGVV